MMGKHFAQCFVSAKEVPVVASEDQQDAQMIYTFSICSTYMFRSCLTIIRVRCVHLCKV